MNEVEIEAWVAQAPQGQQGFREAVHTILDGIGHSQNLSARMVMKGGLLLAIRYEVHATPGTWTFPPKMEFGEKLSFSQTAGAILVVEYRAISQAPAVDLRSRNSS